MKIEVYGRCNPDGISHPSWMFEIANDCDRVLITESGFYTDQKTPKVWGFKADVQVAATLVDHNPTEVWVA